jgi:hypothetical protein
MPELANFYKNALLIGTATLTLLVLFIWLMTISGKKYSVQDTEAHSEKYAGLVKEGHGGMTSFLWVIFTLSAIWMIYYIILNWSQFYIILYSK